MGLVEDALSHPVVVTIEDGLADGGVGSALADDLRRRSEGAGPRIAVLGVPDGVLLRLARAWLQRREARFSAPPR